jgi:hypothetical protein
MSTNFAKEFKLYESLFSKQKSEKKTEKVLKESRSTMDIQVEIDRLQQELQQAKVAEKSDTYNGKFPTVLYAWDMYIGKKAKGTWCSAEKEDGTWDGIVFETEEDAINSAITLLGELADERELKGDPDDYTIDTFTIPITELTIEDLEYSNLEHLIPAIIE